MRITLEKKAFKFQFDFACCSRMRRTGGKIDCLLLFFILWLCRDTVGADHQHQNGCMHALKEDSFSVSQVKQHPTKGTKTQSIEPRFEVSDGVHFFLCPVFLSFLAWRT